MSTPKSDPGPKHDKPLRTRGRPPLDPTLQGRILEEAEALMAEQGLEGMQARALTRRVGISTGSLYKFYGDMDDIIRAVNARTYQRLYTHQKTCLDKAQREGLSVEDRLMALAGAYIDFIGANPRAWLGVLAFNRRQQASTPQSYRARERALFELVEEALEGLSGLTEMTQRQRSARALWASVHGMVTLTVLRPDQSDAREESLAQIQIIVGAFVRTFI
ncbi:TetR/AcrR family transcriptional regulator [Woodsholea maritima]|uniref:TetR/AcrR family transcriptional regulator n=1 Tax=Woodsholea maritima TaxID=240237 RepID=UPI0003633D3C|nr:TetR/AcrR family transcriptional regulator [Woodsholea maritima]